MALPEKLCRGTVSRGVPVPAAFMLGVWDYDLLILISVLPISQSFYVPSLLSGRFPSSYKVFDIVVSRLFCLRPGGTHLPNACTSYSDSPNESVHPSGRLMFAKYFIGSY